MTIISFTNKPDFCRDYLESVVEEKYFDRVEFLIDSERKFYRGFGLGYEGYATGEVCFNTSITGYQEILTDPSYCQQIVVMASPHIGNYGVNKFDEESDKVQVSGFVLKEETIYPSNWRSESSIGDYLIRNNITGIKNLDTRAIVSHIRDKGAMNGIISSIDHNKTSLLKKLKTLYLL